MKNNNRWFYYLCLIGFLGIFSTTISKSPVLPLLVKNGLGGNDALLGLISFFSPLAGVLFSFPLGFFADRFGSRRLLIVSAIIFTVAPLSYIFVTNPYLLIPLRFCHGIATAILGPIAASLIVSQFRETKGEKLGTYSSATLLGRTIAPAIGGYIISLMMLQTTGLIVYYSVYLLAFVSTLPILFLVLLLPVDGPLVLKSGEKFFSVRDLWRALKNFVSNQLLLSTALVEMAIYFCYGVLETFLPGYLTNLKFEAKIIGLIFSLQIISIALSKPLFGRLADRIDKRWQIIGGILVVGVSLFSFVLSQDLILISLFSILFGLGLSFATVATSTYVSEITAKENLGSSLGALSSIMDIGQSFGPLLVGAAIVYFGSTLLGFSLAGILCLVSALYFFLANFIKRV
jgi:MFS family permease